MNVQTAMIYTMVMASAVDGSMTDNELDIIGDIVGHLPIFHNFDVEKLPKVAADCAKVLSGSNGVEKALTMIEDVLTPPLRETAYALACDVVAADLNASEEELQFLEVLQDEFDLDPLTAVAIERASHARFRRV